MKPNFALTLSFDGIGLLHRAFPGWHMVGEVSLDSGNLSGDLAALLEKAKLFESASVHTKLVLPNDQIRYLQVDAEGLGPDEIADAVARALDGATPYAIDDLVYDWSISAGQVYIAAVAADTLNEAEAFAKDHGFNPLCFVAIPESMDFVGEPWFGQTKTAAELLADGSHVVRDTAAIRVIGDARLPAQEPDIKTEPEPEPEDNLFKDIDAAEEKAQPETSDAVRSGFDDLSDGDRDQDVQPTTEEAVPQPRVSVLDDPLIPDDDSDPFLFASSNNAESAVDDTDAVEASGTDDDTADPGEDAESVTEAEPDDVPEAAVAFTSIRAMRDAPATSAPKLSGATRQPDNTGLEPEAETEPEERTEPPLRTEPAISAAPPEVPPIEQVLPETVVSQDTAIRLGASLSASDDERLMASVPSAVAPDVSDDAPSFASRRDALIAKATARYTAKETENAFEPDQDERQRMTIFGAREPVRVGGKPRFLGVVLTAALLIFLVGVAAWASIFLDDGISRMLRGGPDDTTVASVPDVEDATAEELAEEEPDFTLETGEFGATVASLPGTSLDHETPPQEAQPDARPAQLTQEEARARYAVTGVWQRAPEAPVAPESIALEDFYLTSIDPKVSEQDAVALPDLATLQSDLRPQTQLDPPAADTVFALDGRGLVQATPNGAVTPSGIRVFAGQPRLVPGERPDPPAQLVVEGEEVVPTDPALARLAEIRPRPRPGDLSEQNERSNLGGRTRSELAGLRPKLRPQSAQELAEQAAAASTTAAALPSADTASVEAAIAAAVQQQPDPFAGATSQAVQASLKPQTRPQNMAQIVQRSQQQQTQAVQTAAVVPSNQRVTPSAPTATTVARAATEQNVLKLRRVNLIGVYGSPSNRRALVRMPNGRYKKVKIGDRLDGGRVAAIGDSEIRYVKGGRNVVLKMPSG